MRFPFFAKFASVMEGSRRDRDRMDRKIRTVRFLLLSLVLFLFADSVGRWFVPSDVTIPGMLLAAVWVTCILSGAVLFYGMHKIRRAWRKWLLVIAFYAVFIVLLCICGFYSYGGMYLVGYRISVSLVPLFGALVTAGTARFIKWYGISVKKLFGMDSIQNVGFFLCLLVPLAVVVFLFIGSYRLSGSLADRAADMEQLALEGEINHNTDHREPVRQYDRIFNDLNDTQLEAARRNGLKSAPNTADVENDSRLVKIESNRYYQVDKLTHSMPYLVPKAAQLVEDMGRAFQDSLFNRGYSRNHKFTVTSVLRTQETVRSLQKTNPNSTTNSAHCYGTTVDISYFTFQIPETGKTASVEKMRQVLMQVVYDMRSAGRCYVKYEKKQTCLHITVR